MNQEKMAFLKPQNPTHRQYEALRAFFVDELSQEECAKKFGYSLGTFRVMCCKFRKNLNRPFFLEPQPGPIPVAESEEDLKAKIIALRKQNRSIYEIAAHLQADGRTLTPPAIGAILKKEGFARLPRRRDEEIVGKRHHAEPAPVADVRSFDLTERTFHTKFGGLFLFLPLLAQIPFDRIFEDADLPGSEMIPSPHAVRSILALKLFGNARHTHVMSDVFDEGLGLFAGLNVIPKASFLSQYSCRVNPAAHPKILQAWFDAIRRLDYVHGDSFDLDFHTIPSHGEDSMLQKHYSSKRSRRQKGILAFVVNDTNNRAFCYVNADLRKATQDDEVLRFIEFWKKKSGNYPKELVFDSTFATYGKLDTLNQKGINFITLRRRTKKLLDQINSVPSKAWTEIELENVSRQYRTPKVLEDQVVLAGYNGTMRQFAIRDLGHEYPTILLTNQEKRTPADLIQRYARRMIIENNIADAIDFFHMDALSSTVALKVNFDLTATVIASTLYRCLAARIGHDYQSAKFARIFRDFVHATATVSIGQKDIQVRFQKRAHNPMLIAAGFDRLDKSIPWIGGRKLRLLFG